MNITARFRQWNDRHRNKQRRLVFSWDRTFTINDNNTNEYELALGYIYALKLVKPSTSTVDITTDIYPGPDSEDFFHFPFIKRHFVSTHAHPPQITEKVDQYLTRIRRKLTMEYLIVITPDPNNEDNVHLIQFNNVIFLQGFLSVLRGFNKPQIDYIVTIYGRDGKEYITH